MGSNYQIELIELIDFPGLMKRARFVTRDAIVGIFVKTLATDEGLEALNDLSALLCPIVRVRTYVSRRIDLFLNTKQQRRFHSCNKNWITPIDRSVKLNVHLKGILEGDMQNCKVDSGLSRT